jgi:hypothetical protein
MVEYKWQASPDSLLGAAMLGSLEETALLLGIEIM